MGKTTSDVKKIISDIIQTTSDLFFTPYNPQKNRCLYWHICFTLFFYASKIYAVCRRIVGFFTLIPDLKYRHSTKTAVSFGITVLVFWLQSFSP